MKVDLLWLKELKDKYGLISQIALMFSDFSIENNYLSTQRA